MVLPITQPSDTVLPLRSVSTRVEDAFHVIFKVARAVGDRFRANRPRVRDVPWPRRGARPRRSGDQSVNGLRLGGFDEVDGLDLEVIAARRDVRSLVLDSIQTHRGADGVTAAQAVHPQL